MSFKKQILFLTATAFLAMGCNKAAPGTNVDTNTQEKPKSLIQEGQQATSLPKGWVIFSSQKDAGFTIAIPSTWSEDRASSRNHFILRSRINADGTRAGDAFVEFTTKPVTGKSLSEQLLADVAYGKNVSQTTLGKTDSGLQYAYATFTDPTSTVKNWAGYVVGLGPSAYVLVVSASNGENTDVLRMVKSIKLKL